MKIRIVNTSDLPLPKYETEHSAGLDLRSTIDLVLEPGKFKGIPTGIKLSLPRGYEAQVRARGGTAFRNGIGVVNAPGTVDADYRGEIHVILINWGEQPFEIKKGTRIAQLIVNKHETIEWEPVEELDETKRGEGRFSSTGLS
ncbi:dUTP diphosphatase [archaeon]|nr:dUTP diphosphatase [archaeon]|tara:strand:- start:225 stop:653 length:429 start_codon:yes stop_codon:yes gene_type:complete